MDQFSPRYNARYPIDLSNCYRNAVKSLNQFRYNDLPCANRKYLTNFQDSLIIRDPGLFIRKRWYNQIFPRSGIPRTEIQVGNVILLGNRVRAHNRVHPVFFLNEPGKICNPRAGGIPDDQTSGKVEDLRTIVLHLLRYVLDVPAGAPVADRKPDQLHAVSFVRFKRPFAVAQCPKALAPGTGPVPVADDDSQFNDISRG
jgi:hypothetical protein